MDNFGGMGGGMGGMGGPGGMDLSQVCYLPHVVIP